MEENSNTIVPEEMQKEFDLDAAVQAFLDYNDPTAALNVLDELEITEQPTTAPEEGETIPEETTAETATSPNWEALAQILKDKSVREQYEYDDCADTPQKVLERVGKADPVLLAKALCYDGVMSDDICWLEDDDERSKIAAYSSEHGEEAACVQLISDMSDNLPLLIVSYVEASSYYGNIFSALYKAITGVAMEDDEDDVDGEGCGDLNLIEDAITDAEG